MMMKVTAPIRSYLGRCSGSSESSTEVGVEPVLPGDVRQLFLGGIHHVQPDEGRLVAVDDGAYGHVWQIRLAAAAAPKPLSMFTTVTPAAQEFSMPSSAASPPNEAP